MAEASDILSIRRIIHAAIDVDALGAFYLPSSAGKDNAVYSNVWSVVQNYAAQGIDRFLLARAIESLAELETCRSVVSAQEVIVCRVLASIETMEQRVRNRESGPLREEYVARVSKLNAILDRAPIESVSVANEDRPQADSAREMLIKAGWISS